MHDRDLHLVGAQPGERVDQRFLRALHVRLDDEVQHVLAALGHLVEHVLELRGLLLRELDVAELALPEERDLARFLFVGEHHHVLTGIRHLGKALDLHRNRGTGVLHGLAGLVQHGTHAAEHRPGEHDVATVQRARLHKQRRHRTAALVEPGFDHHALGRGVDRGPQLEHLGLEEELLEQFVDSFAGLRRNRYHRRVAAEFLRYDAVAEKLLLDLVRVRLVLVDLV